MILTVLQIATSICQRLVDRGFIAYFAGGYVRDLLLQIPCHEIDIATSATPDEIATLFTKTVAVGKQFGVMVVIEGGNSFEISTFRKDHPYLDGRHPDGIDFSTPEKDAARRDFTINGMFYDPLTQTIYDYVGGEEDLKKGVIRAIGNPLQRFQEDRLRMIRAVRFSARFSFPIEKETEDAIKTLAHTLFPSVSIERVWQELQKMAASPHFKEALLLLQEMALLPIIFPLLEGVDITPLVEPFSDFPADAPTILYLLPLFPANKRIELCQYLKLSNEESKLALFFSDSDDFFQKQKKEPYHWAQFYAHPQSKLYIQIKGATLPARERDSFFAYHNSMQKKLHSHIERLKKKEPLVRSNDLQQLGIPSSKRMGELLEEAIRISINEDLSTKEEVLERLRHIAL